MSVNYYCDCCETSLEPGQAQGYRLQVAGYEIDLRPSGHLCVPCIVNLLKQAAGDTHAEVKTMRDETVV